jgi:hypothetical protein
MQRAPSRRLLPQHSLFPQALIAAADSIRQEPSEDQEKTFELYQNGRTVASLTTPTIPLFVHVLRARERRSFRAAWRRFSSERIFLRSRSSTPNVVCGQPALTTNDNMLNDNALR